MLSIIKPYSSRPTSDEIVYSNKSTVYNQRKVTNLNQKSKPIDMDRDEGGIYKARKAKTDSNATEIPDNDNMIVDLPIEKQKADDSFAAAACIGCGACVAACPNASAMLFVSAKVSHLALLPQGAPERKERALNMVAQMDKEGFGSCTNIGACEAECPKGISLENIARLNREYIGAMFAGDK